MRTALVTGGSSGIGLELCRQLLDDGYRVLNLARRPCELRHGQLENVIVDLADTAATERLARELAAEHTVTDIVHNAGAIRPALLEEVAAEDLAVLSQLHLGAAIALVQANLDALRACGSGRIVLIGSRAAQGLATRTVYSATKAGLLGMARTWALELAGAGITVNVVAPGPIGETEMFDSVMPAQSERARALAASIPVQRLGRPGDVAHAVRFFLDERSGFITGQTLLVCGGSSVGALTL
jgi:NAD(P)-dependent dehydrogenase (short-subunit alcohol dehydrogenase family)